jgi:hypothetical protein
MATPVVLTTGARPIVPVESGGVPMTPVDTLGEPVTVVDALGEPVVLINNDGTPAFLAYSAKTYLGGVAPFHWLDFINNRALYAGADVGTVAGGTGYSFTRASDGYYQNADGTLTLFGSGALRRGDRGVLIEGARTNSVIWSQDFSNAAWTKTSTTLTSGQADPAGGTAAFTLNGSGFFPRIEATAVTTTAAAWTISVFVRRGGSGTIAIAFSNVGGADEVSFDLAAGTFGTPGANISSTGVQALNANWWRIWAVSTRTATTAIGRVFSGYPSNASPTIFGFQYELGAFPSSYIPTVAASATRAADVLTYTVNTTAQIQAAVAGQPELVTNGTFATDTDWANESTGTGTAVISGGTLTTSSTDGSNVGRRTQTLTTQSGRYYAVSVEQASTGSAGVMALEVAGAFFSNLTVGAVTTVLFQASAATTKIGFRVAGNNGTRTIDNVSVKEVPANSLTLYPTTAWTQFQRSVDTGGAERILTLSNGTTANRFGLQVTSGDVFAAISTGNNTADGDATTSGSLAVGTSYKGAASIDTNDLAAVQGGGSEVKDTSVTLPQPPTTIHVGTNVAGADPVFGYVERFAIIQGYKTTAERQGMTS